MGHESERTTMEWYTKIDDEQKRAAHGIVSSNLVAALANK
jgi:hypothetical protein